MLVPSQASPELGIKQIDNKFKQDLMILTAKHFAFKMFLPSCFRVPITIFRSLKYIKKALKSLLDCKVNVDVLDGASITACLLQRNFKTAGTVMFLLSVSGLLEDYTHARTKAVLTDSLAIKTDKVWLVTDDGDVLIPIDDLSVGDNIRVQTGKIIPIDAGVHHLSFSSQSGTS